MQLRLRWPLLAVAVALVPAGAVQVTPATVTIEGQVVEALTSRPLPGAVVRANARAAFRTGQDGRFVFRLAAGTITLSASKTGYIDANADPIEIVPSLERRDLVVRLAPEGLISGRVVDRSGGPMPRVTVRAVPRGEIGIGSGVPAVTDDLGHYTIGGLEKGEYVVGIDGGISRLGLQSYSALFFPATPSRADAAGIQVAAGVEQRGIDFLLNLDASSLGNQSNRLLAQAPATGAIGGVVQDRLGRGLSRVVVQLAETVTRVEVGGGPPPPAGAILLLSMLSTSTDEHGRFQFMNLGPGRFTLVAAQPDCLDAPLWSGARTDVQIASGQRLRDVFITLPESGVLSGTLTDEFGDPHAASVFLSEWNSWSTGPPARTDPRGRFRFSCLAPGDYRLTVDHEPSDIDLRMRNGNHVEQTVAMRPVYYPGVSDPSLAAPVSVRAGADAGGFTVVVRPEPVTTVDVTIDTGGREITNTRLMRVPLDDRWDYAIRTSNDGRRLESVPAGRFMLVADGELQGNTPLRLSAIQEITADGVMPLSVTLTLQPGGRISGRLVFEGTTPPPATFGALLMPIGPGAMRALTGTQRNASFNGEEFSIADVLPGRYLLRVTQVYPSPTWMLKSITMGGQNILDLPIEMTSGSDFGNVVVTFTNRVTEISGIVTDTTGHPLVLESVVVFPADSRHWRTPSLLVKAASTDTTGRYVITGLPPGDYRIAVSPTWNVSASPSMFSKLLPQSVSVAIAPGDRKVVNVTVR